MTNAVWITGATSGIGKSLTKIFNENGENIIASARRSNELQRLSEICKNESAQIIPVALDVSKHDQISSVYKELKQKFNIVGLINNAGISNFSSAKDNSFKEITEIINTNLLGAIYLSKIILPDMINAKNGRIINILSVVTKKIFTNSSVYSASKSGLEAFMNVLREEVREHNIRVINIYPGATKTPIWPNKILEKYSNRMMNPDHVAKIIYDSYKIQDNYVVEEIVLKPISGDL